MNYRIRSEWQMFTGDGPDFPNLVFIESLLDAGEVGCLDGLLRAAVGNLTASGDKAPRVRAFRSNALDYRLSDELVRTVAGPSESPVDWLRRAAGAGGGCVAINGLAAWSLELAEWFSALVASLMPGPGREPLSGTDVYTFIADCEWTPFGIHCDAEPSMIIHLGPSEKTVWVWPDGALPEELFLRSPSFNGISFEIESHLSSAESFTLRPGDFVSIPRGRYHLFRNDGPSAFLGLTVYPLDRQRLLRSAVTTVIDDVLLPDIGEFATMREFEDNIQELMRDHAFGERIASSIEARFVRKYAVERSSGHVDRPNRAVLDGRGELPERMRGAFPGVLSDCGRGELVVRGRTLRTNVALDLRTLTDRVNSCAPLALSEWLETIAALGPENGRELVAALYRVGGLVDA